MENPRLNDLLKRFYQLNKVLQNETYLIVDRINKQGVSAENSLMFKSYTDMVSHLRDDITGVCWDIREELHKKTTQQ